MIEEVSPGDLKAAIESQHGGNATFVQAVPVREEFQGEVAFEGVVHVFGLEGHPKADRAYAWSDLLDEQTGRRRFYAVLHVPPVTSPVEAVRAAIVADHRGKH